ncbi:MULTISPECIES: flagellar export protein FliJ [unclassified Colwellia]|jgi:flagellar FliJ protein|uniref:flagellar export protein FliJ n=1 Tax=unclassified Colwellia TaxID=196834 RepID=UPI0015F6F266|nr:MULTISPECIES: flagellar export protein FliJ [unclassified Colwellia]MBA6233421.1 flagellar export protein FliJ [Colwellia sp. MB02u-7]MBA6236511.1 flagellar export protein FliJ [Colwellia sp. MB02u-11]MBA6257045.1 flagellar export protein FliJ [Colwellia sp. MB3u-28]MBA6260950.1 flagellar export protein FliJ [Colwellia sp. MB3u-41]MBA6298090.1 flagellar export protein FliJ [Colwellia sp. MB3u-22]
MPLKQLDTLHRYEQDKEKKAAQALQTAEFEYQQNIERLNSVSEYRLEYMKRLNERSMVGIDSATFSHFHAFIAKLDNAAQQVDIAITQSKAIVEQSKQQWFAQRQKIQAVELLRDKKRQALAIIANKQEQKMFDEIATQQFVRQKMQR